MCLHVAVGLHGAAADLYTKVESGVHGSVLDCEIHVNEALSICDLRLSVHILHAHVVSKGYILVLAPILCKTFLFV
jgi:hypothetical protein